MAVANNVAARLGFGEMVEPFATPGVIAGNDPYATWLVIRDRLLEALDQQGSLQRIVETSAGPMAVDDHIVLMMSDALIHTWDIARSSGGDERLDHNLVAAVLATYQARDAEGKLRTPGRYGAPAAASPDASTQDQLLAFVGRSV